MRVPTDNIGAPRIIPYRFRVLSDGFRPTRFSEVSIFFRHIAVYWMAPDGRVARRKKRFDTPVPGRPKENIFPRRVPFKASGPRSRKRAEERRGRRREKDKKIKKGERNGKRGELGPRMRAIQVRKGFWKIGNAYVRWKVGQRTILNRESSALSYPPAAADRESPICPVELENFNYPGPRIPRRPYRADSRKNKIFLLSGSLNSYGASA